MRSFVAVLPLWCVVLVLSSWLSLSLPSASAAAVASPPSPVSSAPPSYVIVIDAGSTGSRIHVHSYSWAEGEALPTIAPSVNEKIKPGLSDYATQPDDAVKPVEQLLQAARKVVPEAQRAATPIHLQATAGLRSVTERQAADILRVVRSTLRASEFLFQDDWALIISGEQEGINGWLATNYLLGAFDPTTAAEAHGVVEMGGASMQITFALADPAPVDKPRLTQLTIAGTPYYLYTHSYLSYGLQAAQKLYQQLVIDEIEEHGNPCYPAGYRFTSKGDFDKCIALMERVVDKSSACEFDFCGLSGVYQPRIRHEPFLAIENFFYTSKFFHGSAETSVEGEVTRGNLLVGQLKQKGREYCDDDWATIQRDHAQAIADKKEDLFSLSYYCFAAAYEAAVLETGFGFTDTSNIRPARAVNKKSIDWELGAALVEVTKASGLQLIHNPQVTQWQPDWAAGVCRSATCRFSVLAALLLSSVAAYLCLSRLLRRSPVNRGYSMLAANDRSGGALSGLFAKV